MSVRPVEPVVFSLYLAKLIQENLPVSSTDSALHRVSSVQKKVGQPQVTENPLMTQVTDAALIILARPPERKKPLTVDWIKDLNIY